MGIIKYTTNTSIVAAVMEAVKEHEYALCFYFKENPGVIELQWLYKDSFHESTMYLSSFVLCVNQQEITKEVLFFIKEKNASFDELAAKEQVKKPVPLTLIIVILILLFLLNFYFLSTSYFVL